MGLLGQFIDTVTEHHPELMEQVRDNPIGGLNTWLNVDQHGKVCGCFIGTVALAAQFSAWDVTDVERFNGNVYHRINYDSGDMLSFVATAVSNGKAFTRAEIDDVGMQALDIARRLAGYTFYITCNFDVVEPRYPEAEQRTIHMIKNRVTRALTKQQQPV